MVLMNAWNPLPADVVKMGGSHGQVIVQTYATKKNAIAAFFQRELK
jgi:hypothetical protein